MGEQKNAFLSGGVKVSKVLRDYYCVDVLTPASEETSATRFENFDNIVERGVLLEQVERFSTNYNYLYNKYGNNKVAGVFVFSGNEARFVCDEFRRWMESQKTKERKRRDAAKKSKGIFKKK